MIFVFSGIESRCSPRLLSIPSNSGAGLPATKATAAISPFLSFSSATCPVSLPRFGVTFNRPKTRRRGNGGPAAGPIDIDSLAGQIGNGLDIRPREKMEFFVIELGNVSDAAFAPRQTLLPQVIDNIGLQDRHIDSMEPRQIREILYRTAPNYWQDPSRRAIVNDIADFFGDANRNVGSALSLEFHHAFVARLSPLVPAAAWTVSSADKIATPKQL